MDVNTYRGFKSFSESERYVGWKTYYNGYDYSKTLLRRSLSNYLYQNEKVAGFLEHLNRFMVEMVDNVKYIRNFFNYAVPKDYKRIN
jgi:hypothetical protein